MQAQPLQPPAAMDNQPALGLPPVPPDVANWHVYVYLRTCVIDFGRTAEVVDAHRLARRVLLRNMHNLSSQRCDACSGFGHKRADCPTNDRLSVLG